MHPSQVILISVFTSVITAGSTVYLMDRLQVVDKRQVEEASPELLVPNLQGLAEADARANLSAAGLVTLLGPRKPSDRVAPETVAEQIPLAGQAVKKGATVTITLAAALPEVPDVLKQAQDEAANTLQKLQFEVEFGEPTPHPDIPKGHVVSQVPKSGETAKLGSKVLLRVSTGPEPVLVPKVTGLNLASAKKQLADAGLALGTVSWVHDPDLFANAILRQDPEPSSKLAPGATVSVTVNRE